jgi:DmsE family decaheme c-type cytochrome
VPGSNTSPRKPRRTPRRRLVCLLALPLLALAYGPVPQDKTAPFPRHGGYIGRADCVECHEAEEAKIVAGTHSLAIHDERMQACETCHGPALAHADDDDNDTGLITFPPKLGFAVQRRLCGRCHEQQITDHGGDLLGFVAAGKKCTDCHKIHTKKKPAPHAGLRFVTRKATEDRAKPVGAKKCLTCHPLRNDLLSGTGHQRLMADRDRQGCETCHGNGGLHVETGGLARLITRPDVAKDGAATCRSCHSHVDPVEFHWKDERKPLLTPGMTCATCHTIHAGSAAEHGKARKVAPPPPPSPPQNSACLKCHAPAYGVLHDTIHESLGRRDIPLSRGCGACHAGAAEHAAGPGRKALVESMHGTDAAFQTKTCAQCHKSDRAMRHARIGSHFKNQVTCLTCHSPAAPKGKVREDASQECAKCHTKAAAEFRLPNHHPVTVDKHGGGARPGTMSCVDCHDPHSARPRIRNRQLRRQTCVKCHKEYRGPFVFAHQASRTEGCVACHSPHGSTNRRMLVQHTSQQNCLQCHGDFPSFHDQTKGAVFTDCLKCHTEVHGSNHSRYFFR